MTDTRLTDEQIASGLTGTAWHREGETIVRDLQRENFLAVIAAVNQVAELAEAANHHPDLLVHGWNRLRITLSTHSAGGLTAADLALAERIDGVLGGG
ncbi:4a-hydroxytetrahydrobiopterin dehydratase [Conexibacter sp. DBS9H8]|uniref:4a-hydroxytetrahydrobiopterin dehydratase n=1 Tax=Conexibacter sp. DBS9H8 TaxID=2937801 RepID=UPI00200EA3FA|nr:4a-hydroxytetrahydrobiopterin dehydratase [Conexibacter sp. DBS9H8]